MVVVFIEKTIMSDFNQHRTRNFLIGLTLACAFVLYAFNYKTQYVPGKFITVLSEPDDGGIIILSGLLPPPPPPPVERRQRQRDPIVDIRNANIIEVSNNTVLTALATTSRTLAPQPTPVAISMNLNSNRIKTYADVMPEFPGGESGMETYLKKVIQVSDYCLEELETNMVRVSFIIDEYGDVNMVKLIDQDIPQCLKAEVIRAIEYMPQWTPGMDKGRPVRVQFVKPFRFNIL